MQIVAALEKNHFPQEIIDIFAASKIKEFYPPQAAAIEKGALDGRSLLLSIPTAAGKTLIAELAMLKALVQNKGRCLYIVPLKAMASEKYEDFKAKYSHLGIKVGYAVGDLDSEDRFLNRNQILIATAEKVDSLLRSKAQWLINSLGVVVLDEIHFINDVSRGPTLEILTTRIRHLNPQAQILALSATVQNAEELAGWLKAELVKSTWRPIPLKEGVYYNEHIRFHGSAARIVKEDADDDVGKLSMDTLRGGGQVLVFVNSRRSAQAASRQLCPHVTTTLNPEEKKLLAELSREITGPTDSTKVCRTLGEAVKHGVAFHHAGLKPRQRKLVEDHFKQNLIKVICSTPTLAAGVNLPARRTIVRDIKRFESGVGAAFIPVSEYKQCAGRAGRPQYDTFGEAVIIAKSGSEANVLFDRYITASAEPVISKLGQESSLRIHILASIAGGYVHDINETFAFISQTFLAYQRQGRNLIELIASIFEFLQKEGFIEKDGFRYFATRFGQCTSRLYIDPMSAIILRNGLKRIEGGKSFSNIGLLHLTCCCPDSPRLNLNKNDIEDLEMFANRCQDEFILTPENCSLLEDYLLQGAVLKTTLLLSKWIDEESEDLLCEQFNVGPGDIFRQAESTRWLLHAGIVFADLLDYKKLTLLLSQLERRIQYGIKEELLELTSLKGVGRIRARNLFHKGYKNLASLKNLSVDTLAAVPQIGKALAKEILDQVLGKPKHAVATKAAEESMDLL